MSDKELIEALCGWLGSGRVDNSFILPVLKDLSKESRPSLSTAELLQGLQTHPGVNFESLAAHIRSRRRSEASRCHQRRKAGETKLEDFKDILGDLPLAIPLGWTTLTAGLQKLRAALTLIKDRYFLQDRQQKAPKTSKAIEDLFRQALPIAGRIIDPLPLIELLETKEDVGERRGLLAQLRAEIQKTNNRKDAGSASDSIEKALLESKTLAERQRLLDMACSWPTSRMAPLIRRMGEAPELRERALLLMTLRFNEPTISDWNGWLVWLSTAEEQDKRALQEYEAVLKNDVLGTLIIWLHSNPEIPEQIRLGLESLLRQKGATIDGQEFLDRKAQIIPFEERELFADRSAKAPTIPRTPAAAIEPLPVEPTAPKTQTPEIEDSPSLWDEHILPFFANNWTMLAGIAMVVLGSSLLAYYTWDKHWFVRYTILPALLGGFTAVLARAGAWLEDRSASFKSTADMLRGAAIALLPANFMAVALMAGDPQVTHKDLVLPAVSLAYLLIFGRGLRKWCSSVHPSLGNLLGSTLLLINSLVVLGPLVRVFSPSGTEPWFLLGVGFHIGFLAMAFTIVRFIQSGLSRSLVEEGRVPWFFGVSLTSTFLQVFLWVHGFMRHLPHVYTYACLVIATGGLILFSERSSLVAHEKQEVYGKESFLGYALILLGLFMGASNQTIRLVALELAGVIWFGQALSRRDILHAWIAFTLLLLGGGSLGTWDLFPGRMIPVLSLGLALAAGGLGFFLSRWWAELKKVGEQMHVAILNITTVLAVLVQWHYDSPPLHTAGVLLGVAALLGWRAHKDQNLVYVHSVMAIMAIALPYMGFADMSGRTLRGNNVVFGLSLLSFLWLALIQTTKRPLLMKTRSTVLFIYGALSVAAMCLRVYFEQGRQDNILGPQVAMSLGGPLLIAVSLVFAAYFSRSLLPAIMASLILVILMPQLKMEIRQFFPFIQWGSGLMSSVWAVALTLGSFNLRSSTFLNNLGEGDLFAGRVPFPLQRRDHTLFTWPLIASAIFFASKVDAWNLVNNLANNGVHLKTAAALYFAGVAWTLMAVYFRRLNESKAMVHAGWISAMAGLAFGYYDRAADPQWHQAALICGVAMNSLYLFYRHALEKTYEWAHDLLTAPMRSVLSLGTVLVSSAALLAIVGGADIGKIYPLMLTLAADLCWFGLIDGNPLYGTLLFLEAWTALLAWTAPGAAPLLERLSPQLSFRPTLAFFLAIQAFHVAMEQKPSIHQILRPLAAPFFLLASLATFVLGIHGLFDGIGSRSIVLSDQWLLISLVLATARGQACGPLVLMALLLGYADLFSIELAALRGVGARVDFLLSPWRLGAFSLAMASLATAGEWVQKRWPWIAEGRLAQRFFRLPALPWVHGPAMLFASYAVLQHSIEPRYRRAEIQLWTPYLAASSFALIGISWQRASLFALSSLFLTLGNIHMVRFYLGPVLREHGLLENHLLCLGAVATLIEFSLARLLTEREKIVVFMNRVCLGLAGFILALLSATYFIRANLEMMSNARFLVSGLMAYLAGRYFQRAARHPDAGEAPYVQIWEGLYHFGVTTSIWCAALLIPWFRNPYAAFPALGLPVLYFYLRSEIGSRTDPATVLRYRNTAAALAFFMLILYTFRSAFQMVLFPDAPLGVEHYHFNAPFVMILSLAMLRLHGLGGTTWLAFYGGLSMMVGSYFTLTRFPGMSPFDYPMPSAWCAVGLGHFWMLFSSRPSPVRTFIQRMAAIDGPLWDVFMRSWGLFLLAATQTCLLWGLMDHPSNTTMAAPLLLGGASLLVHQGIIRGSRVMFVFAALEFMAALHADFFVASYLPKEDVVWVLLALWSGVLLYVQTAPQSAISKAVGQISFWSAAVTMAHVFYHHPDSTVGLWAFADGATLAAMTPRGSRRPDSGSDRSMAMGLLFAPTWLVFFGQSSQPFPWSILITTAALFLTGHLARWVQERFGAIYTTWQTNLPRLFDQTVSLLCAEGFSINSVLLYLVFALTATVQASHYGSPFLQRDLALILGLYGASAMALYHEGKLRKTMPPYFLLQFCVLGFFAVVRRQLMLTSRFWNYEYDVWASLLVSFSLAGAKQILPMGPSEARIPLLGTLLTMPVAVMLWVLIHGLGTNTVLLVVGLYSLMFAYMGKDDRESPYHLVAVGGFIAFILIVFWTKLELRVIQAYVIPVGLGILMLLQMFRDKISPVVRNEIRAVTLLAMLGSSGYYALVDDRYPMAFHMTLLVLGVLAMSLGSFLRIRLYVFLGLAGVVTDLAAILYKVLVHMERSARMTLIGTQVLILGAVLIGGAIIYKTHQEEFDSAIGRWRGRLMAWE